MGMRKKNNNQNWKSKSGQKFKYKGMMAKDGCRKKASLSEIAVNGGASIQKLQICGVFLPNRFENGVKSTPSPEKGKN